MTFWDHLEELRTRLMRCILAASVFAILAFVFKDEVFSVIFAPKSPDFLPAAFGVGPDISIINTELTKQFTVHMMTSFYVGVIVAAPYIIYELYRFISPGLYASEKKYASGIVLSCYAMFLIGTLFNYFIVFPITVRFLAGYQVKDDVANLISLESYIDTFTMLSLLMGMVFELPVLSWLLGKLGIIDRSMMRQYRRHAIVAIVIVAAIITPTSDAFTLTLVSLPIYLLYELSIFVIRNKRVTAVPTSSDNS